MVSHSKDFLWTSIDPRLGETFVMIPEQACAAADPLQLPPVKVNFIFSIFPGNSCMKYLLGLTMAFIEICRYN